MTFRLEVEMGNDAMSEPYDVAGALRRVAEDMSEGRTEGRITDENGNTVGRYEVTA